MTASQDGAPTLSLLRLSDLGQRGPHEVSYRPEAELCNAIAARLDLIALRKARLDGRIVPVGRQDWDLELRLGATVVQPCVATLKPVTTRIDEDVIRRYRAEVEPLEDLSAPEIEMPQDDTLEPLPAAIDMAALIEEALALNLPPFPRAGEADLDQVDFAAPGEKPLTDADLKPFAGLADLRRTLGGEHDDPEDGGDKDGDTPG